MARGKRSKRSKRSKKEKAMKPDETKEKKPTINVDEAKKEKKPIKVNKWNGLAVKHALDYAVKQVFTEKLNLAEIHTLINGRLLIAASAVATAVVGTVYDHFYPFPASRSFLMCCIAAHFMLVAILSLYMTLIEKDVFVVVAGEKPDSTWTASSNMERFGDKYGLTLAYCDAKGAKPRELCVERTVSDFFDENGVLCNDLFEAEVLKMHKSLSGN